MGIRCPGRNEETCNTTMRPTKEKEIRIQPSPGEEKRSTGWGRLDQVWGGYHMEREDE